MRSLVVVVALGLALAPPAVFAQERASARGDTLPDPRLLPPEVAREVIEVFNSGSTLRSSERLEIESGRDVDGDIAVVNGPLTIAGRVTGRVVAINSDVILLPGARIDGGLLVVGGTIEGRDDATIAGDVRVYRQRLQYRHEGQRLVARTTSDEDERWWERRQRWRHRSYSDLRLFSARTYNRVEGLPVYLGPSFVGRFPGGKISVDAFGIFRTANRLDWNSQNIGHSVKSELRFGDSFGIALGGRLFDVVDPTEDWHLSDTEVGLASFFLHRDYRDYYDRHGGSGYAALFLGRDVDLTASLSDERWQSRIDIDPFTLFRNSEGWRPNPELDHGRLHIANGTLRIDTRDNEANPWSGWYLVADYERGTGHLTSLGLTSPGVRDAAAPGPITYERGFVDFRRYNRIAREAQFNLRFVAGGWLSGDELPLQRRLSVGGPGTLPGFDFRRTRIPDNGTPIAAIEDVGQCGGALAPLGVPAQCERIALVQAEYRGDLFFNLFDGWDDWEMDGWNNDAQWVVFADAGRGWLVGPRLGKLQYPKESFPALSTWRSDVGIGVSFDDVGFYVAKAISNSKEPPNFFVRIRRRF